MTDTAAAINAANLGCSLTCKDLEASIRFYRDAIGFAVAQRFENEGKVVAAVVAAGDCSIVLNQDNGKLGWDRIKGQGFYLDVPDDRQAWRAALSRTGFAIERPFLRMHRGPLTTPGQPSSIFAIAGPEFG